MNDRPVRLAVLPRTVAARVITAGIARGTWAVNAANLALAIPLLIEFMTSHGLGGAMIVPLVVLSLLSLLAVASAIIARPWVVIAFLVIGGLGAVQYELSLIAAYPAMTTEGTFLLNRPAVSLVLVAVAANSTLIGFLWPAVGFLVSTTVSVVVSVSTGTGLVTGRGPLLVLILFLVTYLTLARIQASQRRRVPDFEELERETSRLLAEEDRRSRMTAAVHDTLLNDLSIVMTAPDRLDERATARLRADVATLASSTVWSTESADATLAGGHPELLDQLTMLAHDLQWRGLTVHLTGSPGPFGLAPIVAGALLDAVRSCLENVLRHAGVTVAEVELGYADGQLTVIVADEGSGFDADNVSQDRLGLRYSLVERVQAVGGSVKLWSAPGAGTSIVIRVPVGDRVPADEGSGHG